MRQWNDLVAGWSHLVPVGGCEEMAVCASVLACQKMFQQPPPSPFQVAALGTASQNPSRQINTGQLVNLRPYYVLTNLTIGYLSYKSC